MKVRAFRGATQLAADDPVEMESAVCELLTEIFEVNELKIEDLISILFTSTPDLTSEFPAKTARSLNLGSVPLICAVEVDVEGALPRIIRVMVHAHSERSLDEARHIYRRGAQVLRRDIAQ
jgi:chorismate mutase